MGINILLPQWLGELAHVRGFTGMTGLIALASAVAQEIADGCDAPGDGALGEVAEAQHERLEPD
jgi:hypothetical protein